jgi:hypothetical protein
MLMAKSRHRKAENVRRYFRPAPEATAGITSLLVPAASGAGGPLNPFAVMPDDYPKASMPSV